MTSSEKHNRVDGGTARTAPSLPAVRNSAFAKHWLAVDEGGAELTKAVFGAPARRAPPRPAPAMKAPPSPLASASNGAPAPTRLRATLALVLLFLAVLFAEPAARLLGLAPRPQPAGTVEVSPGGKTNPMKPSTDPEPKRAGKA